MILYFQFLVLTTYSFYLINLNHILEVIIIKRVLIIFHDKINSYKKK